MAHSVMLTDGSSFPARTVLICNVLKSNDSASYSEQIWRDTEQKMLDKRISGQVRSVVYPVKINDVGLQGPNVAVVTFSTAQAAEDYASLQSVRCYIMINCAKKFAETISTLAPHYQNRFSEEELLSFMHVMRNLHGITIEWIKGGSCTIKGFSFHIPFVIEVINQITFPVDPKKSKKYPFEFSIHKERTQREVKGPIYTGIGISAASNPMKVSYAIEIEQVFHKYLNKIKFYESAIRNEHLQTVINHAIATVSVRIDGLRDNVEHVVDQLNSMKESTPIIFIKISRGFSQLGPLTTFVDALNLGHKRTCIFMDVIKGVWVMGETAGDCEQQILQRFPELQKDSSSTLAPGHDFPDYVVMLDPDLLKYIIAVHSQTLADIQDRFKVKFSHSKTDEFPQLTLKGKEAKEVDGIVRQMCARWQNKICTEEVEVKERLGGKTLNELQTELQAALEYDLVHGCVKIVADKTKAHDIKKKLSERYGKTGVSGAIYTSQTYEDKPLKVSFPSSSGTVDASRSGKKPSAAKASSSSGGKIYHSQTYDVSPWKTSIPSASGQVSGCSYKVLNTNCCIHAHVCDITKLQVEAIVNAANGHLQHEAGVAGAIARAAGDHLSADCQKYIAQHRYLDVTQNMVTRAGNLPCNRVVHAVGPMMSQYKNPWDCFANLDETFTNCLRTARDKQFISIAIPAISSGHYGVPVEKVTQVMVDSVIEFITTRQTSLQDIHLVDIGAHTVNLIQKQLQKDRNVSQLSNFLGASPSARSHTTTAPDSMVGGKPPKQRAPSRRLPVTSSPASQGTDYRSTQRAYAPPDQMDTTGSKSTTSSPAENCPICMDDVTNPQKLPKCGHTFCKDCVENAFKHKPVCPICGELYGIVRGTQPENGRMNHRIDHSIELPGYRGVSVIVIDYRFPDGKQGPDHPSPGQRYKGTRRTAFLPDNTEGRKVLKLLEKAFEQRVTFTVGRSSTSGQDNVVTWNDIHHKTHIDGGPQRYGYPDPSYLTRVTDELAAKGITDAKSGTVTRF